MCVHYSNRRGKEYSKDELYMRLYDEGRWVYEGNQRNAYCIQVINRRRR